MAGFLSGCNFVIEYTVSASGRAYSCWRRLHLVESTHIHTHRHARRKMQARLRVHKRTALRSVPSKEPPKLGHWIWTLVLRPSCGARSRSGTRNRMGGANTCNQGGYMEQNTSIMYIIFYNIQYIPVYEYANIIVLLILVKVINKL